MPTLTPSERRGALTVALLLLIGACPDLMRARAPLGGTAPRSSLGQPAVDSAHAPMPVDPPPEQAAAPRADGTRLDLNRATAAELDALPGIGPVLAARIVEQRDRHGAFQRSDDLLAIPG